MVVWPLLPGGGGGGGSSTFWSVPQLFYIDLYFLDSGTSLLLISCSLLHRVFIWSIYKIVFLKNSALCLLTIIVNLIRQNNQEFASINQWKRRRVPSQTCRQKRHFFIPFVDLYRYADREQNLYDNLARFLSPGLLALTARVFPKLQISSRLGI